MIFNMNTSQVLAASDAEILKIAEQLRVAYQLKRTIRYAGSRDLTVHGESVAEHVFALLFLAQYFLPLEDPELKMSRERIHEILLFHDFGEIVNGDIPYHWKTKADEAQEAEDAKMIFQSLPQPLGEIGFKRWEEYENRQSSEGLFVYALDKIEPLFELFDPINEKSLKRTKHTYEHNIGRKTDATVNFPVMRKFVDVLSTHMKNRGVFWEESAGTIKTGS
jgi:5'-deoxynucleotidase YfbR-like HD superfamily hydrolase